MRKILLPAIALAVLGCSSGDEPAPPTGGGARPGAPASDKRFPECLQSATTQRVTFVHTNDLHANYQPGGDGVSRYARLRAYYERVRAENPYTVFTNGGDDYEKGSIAELLSQGAATREILHGLGFDVRVIGNHDYAWGPAEVLLAARDPHALVLSANVTYRGSDPGGFAAKPYGTLQVGCVSMGFFGLTSQPWDSRDNAVAKDFFPEFPSNFLYPTVVTPILDAHRSEVDLMVAVTHVGLDVDKSLAAGIAGIDVVLGGHSHTLIPDAFAYVNTVPIAQAGSYSKYAARVDVDVDLVHRKVTSVQYALQRIDDGTISPAPAVQTLVESTLAKWSPEWNARRGDAKAEATKPSLAAIAARALRETLATDAALVDVGTVWDTWRAGSLTPQRFLDAFKVEREPPGTPGFNAAYVATIDGAELQKLVSLDANKWAFAGPTTIDPTRTYTIALQKRAALNADEMPASATIRDPTFEAEMWEILDRYARRRTMDCKYVDAEASLPACP